MPKEKVAARSAGGGKEPAQVLGDDDDDEDDGIDANGKRPAKAAKTGPVQLDPRLAKRAVFEYMRLVCLQMLKIAGFKSWEVEGAGDCSLLAAGAGFKRGFPNPKVVEAIENKQRAVLITKPLRVGGVALLATGKHNELEVDLTEDDLFLISERLGLSIKNRERREKVRHPTMRLPALRWLHRRPIPSFGTGGGKSALLVEAGEVLRPAWDGNAFRRLAHLPAQNRRDHEEDRLAVFYHRLV